MSKQIASLESAATVRLGPTGAIMTTAASVVALDVTSLAGSYVTLQAFAQDVDVYLVHSNGAAPTAAPVITATAIGTANVGRRIVVGTNADFFIPRPQAATHVWLVTKALGAGTLRVLQS